MISGVGLLDSTVMDLRRLWITSTLAERAVATWTTKTTSDTTGLSRIAWSPELGYFITPYLTGGQYIGISSNGSNWTPVVVPLIYPNVWQGICYSSEKKEFVITSSNGGGGYRYIYNTNSTLYNWTRVVDPFSAPSAGTSNPVYSRTLGSFYNIVQSCGSAKSNDGLNWTTYSPPLISSLSSLGVLIFSEELQLFCYVGNNFSMVSSDIINWTASSSSHHLTLYLEEHGVLNSEFSVPLEIME